MHCFARLRALSRTVIPPALAAIAVLFGAAGTASAAPFNEGPDTCKECHAAEFKVWEGSQHAKGFRDFHRRDAAKAVMDAVGDARTPRRSETCQICHYTMIQKGASGRGSADTGPSCESCHGPSSAWRTLHNDYGGPNARREDETPAHRQQRHDRARQAGMIWSFMRYDIAANCMECHGLAHPDLGGEELARMLEADHPLKPEFEMVRYSQGSVRHRFYPPDVTVNQQLDRAGLARLFVEGQMAKLVSATQAAGKSQNARYVAAQKERADSARQALSAVSSVAGMQAFLARPSDAAARKIAETIRNQDLSGAVGRMLPAPNTYK